MNKIDSSRGDVGLIQIISHRSKILQNRRNLMSAYRIVTSIPCEVYIRSHMDNSYLFKPESILERDGHIYDRSIHIIQKDPAKQTLRQTQKIAFQSDSWGKSKIITTSTVCHSFDKGVCACAISQSPSSIAIARVRARVCAHVRFFIRVHVRVHARTS